MRRAKEIKEGYLYEFFDVQSIPNGKTLYIKTFGELFGHPVRITVISPNYGPDYGFFYKVDNTPYSKFGKAHGGTFDIKGQYSVVTLLLYNKEIYYKVYDIINGN